MQPLCENVLRTARWRVAHAFGTTVAGWLVVVPLRHITSLAELSGDEAAELGPLLRDLTVALTAVVGCEKTYVAMFAEAVSHVHFHVVPRMADQPAELLGPKIFDLLGSAPVDSLPDVERDRLATELAARLERLPRRRDLRA